MRSVRKWEGERTFGPDIGEDGVLVLEDGTVIGSDENGATFVNFNPTTMVEALKTGEVIMTHTHPTDVPLSVNDVVAALWDGVREIRAVTEEAVYRMRFTLTATFERKSAFADYARSVLDESEERVERAFKFISMNLEDYPEVNSMEEANRLAARAVLGTAWTRGWDRFPDVIEFYDQEER
jgi:hypothetical protein